MTSRRSLSWLILCGIASSAAAQPDGYGPYPAPNVFGPPGMPYPAISAQPWVPPAAVQAPVPRAVPPVPAVPRPSNNPSAPAADPAAEAGTALREGLDKLLNYLALQEAPNRRQVAAFLDREIAPYFNFDDMAQWVAGPAYGAMRQEARTDLAHWLEADFLTVLATNLAGYQGQRIRVLTPRHGPRGAVNVNVAVLRAGDYPSTLQFRLSKSSAGWRVYDVVADGQSAAAYYRVQFQRRAGGGSAPPR